MNREDVIAAYRKYLGRDPESEDVIQAAIQSGMSAQEFNQQVANSQEAMTNPANLGDIGTRIPLRVGEDMPALADYAYTLATGTNLDLPEYQTAGFTPDQLSAFEQFRGNQGVYKPFLEQGAESTMQGIGALGEALTRTQDAASYIPGTISQGQQTMHDARMDLMNFAQSGAGSAQEAAAAVQRAAGSSDPATRQAAEELMASSGRLGGIASLADSRLTEAGVGAQNVATDVAANSRALLDPLRGDLGTSSGLARSIAETGRSDAYSAAERARSATADAQRALQEASSFGLGAAQQGIAGLRGSSAMYTPDMIEPFMNTYEDAAVQQALADIARQGTLQEEELAARAIQAGAYGGSRQAVAEQELFRNVMEQQGRTAAQMRNQGFESAAARSQAAFEDAMGRQQQASQLTGQLGQIGANAAAGAAESGGRLGLEAEQLAQTGAIQGAQLGLSSEQLASANAQSVAQTGLSIEQLAAQTGLSAQELAGQFAAQSAQIGMNAEQQRQNAATQQAQLAQSQAQLGMRGAESAGQLGLQGAQLGMQGAEQAGNLGLQSANLGLSGIQAGLGAQQQAAGIGQGIASLGQQAASMGAQAQGMQAQDLSTLMQMGSLQQGQTQAEIDTARMNQYQTVMAPYQQLGMAYDFLSGAPTGSVSTMQQPIQSPSLISQIAGFGIAGLGALRGL